jgi:hypothetical protein
MLFLYFLVFFLYFWRLSAINYYQLYLGRAPASQGRHITGFASLGASHASPLHAAHAKTFTYRG